MMKWIFGPHLLTKIDRLGTYAAALAYCLVLSLVPFMVVTFTLGSEIGSHLRPKLELGKAYGELLANILPAENTLRPGAAGYDLSAPDALSAEHMSQQIIALLQSSSHSGLATVGFIFAVYTSFNLMTQIVRTLLFIFDDPRSPQEWNWTVVVKTIGLLFIWMLLLLLLSIISVLSPVLENILIQFHLNSLYWKPPFLVIRDLVGLAAVFGAFYLTYRLVPSRRYDFDQVRDGSLVASCGWMLCSLLFAYVLPSTWQTNAVYKALGSIVIILLWAQVCAWCVIAGACWIVRFSPRRK